MHYVESHRAEPDGNESLSSTFAVPVALDDPEVHFLVPDAGMQSVIRRAKVQNSVPLNWTDEARESFEKTKKMLAKAIALSVPDGQGAADGTNPFLFYGDRSQYAVGGGLSQRPPKSAHLPLHLRDQLRPLGMFSKSLDPV